MRKASITVVVLSAICFAGNTAAAPTPDQVRECVGKKRESYADSKPFTVKGRTECGQATIYTSINRPIPECRPKRNSAPLHYEATKGRQIVGDINFKAISVNRGGGVSAASKQYDTDGNVISAHASVNCESPRICPGGPGSFSEYEMFGFTENVVNDENIIGWTIECTQGK